MRPDKSAGELSAAWDKAVATGKHLVVKPGDKLPLKGVDVQVVTADGNAISSPINGGGAANSFCGGKTFPEDKTENARSTGILITYGKFRMLDLGDLTSQKELEIVCPNNRLGKIDLYLTTHHGLNASNAQAIVHAVAPRVAIMNNGAKKGGSPEAWQIIRSSPGLEDLWQLHFAVAGGKENNSLTPSSPTSTRPARASTSKLRRWPMDRLPLSTRATSIRRATRQNRSSTAFDRPSRRRLRP